MADYIKREDAVRRIAVLMAAEAESDGCKDQPMDNYIEYALEDLADIPSADVVPVVRCKDCKHRIKWNDSFGCAFWGYYGDEFADGEMFCRKGERRKR